MNEQEEEQLVKIGKALRKLREDNNLGSYETFAFENNLSRATVYRMEAGKSNFKIDKLMKVLAVHDLTLEQFFKSIDS